MHVKLFDTHGLAVHWSIGTYATAWAILMVRTSGRWQRHLCFGPGWLPRCVHALYPQPGCASLLANIDSKQGRQAWSTSRCMKHTSACTIAFLLHWIMSYVFGALKSHKVLQAHLRYLQVLLKHRQVLASRCVAGPCYLLPPLELEPAPVLPGAFALAPSWQNLAPEPAKYVAAPVGAPGQGSGDGTVIAAVVVSSVVMLTCAIAVAVKRNRKQAGEPHDAAGSRQGNQARSHDLEAHAPVRNAADVGFEPVATASLGQTHVAVPEGRLAAQGRVHHLRLPPDHAHVPRQSNNMQQQGSRDDRPEGMTLSKQGMLAVCSQSVQSSSELSEASLQDLRM